MTHTPTITGLEDTVPGWFAATIAPSKASASRRDARLDRADAWTRYCLAVTREACEARFFLRQEAGLADACELPGYGTPLGVSSDELLAEYLDTIINR